MTAKKTEPRRIDGVAKTRDARNPGTHLARRSACFAAGVLGLFVAGGATAADHRDSPSTSETAVQPADINDVYTFMNPNDPNELILLMTVMRNAQPGATFATNVAYDFLIEGFVDPNDASTSAGEQRLRCVFPTTTEISCSLGNLVVTGPVASDATDAIGSIANAGGMRVWAGLRDDPFFFNVPGLEATLGQLTDASPEGTPEEREPAPRFEEGVAANLLADPDGTANSFFREDVLSIAIGVDQNLVTAGGTAPVLKVWALTSIP